MKFADEKINLVGCRIWMNNCGNHERLQEYAFRKQLPMIEKYIDGSVGAIVRMMVRGGCLPVREIQECHGSMMMNIVCVVKWSQRSICC